MTDGKDEMRKLYEDSQENQQQSENRESSGESSVDDPSNVKEEWAHLAMYVPPELATEYHEFADNLDARSKLKEQGGLDKNREFNRTVVEFVLENREAIAEEMNLSKDDINI